MSFMHDFPFFHDRPDGFRPDADQIDRRSVDDDGVHLLAGLEAADPIVAVEAYAALIVAPTSASSNVSPCRSRRASWQTASTASSRRRD
jgi:hypothetical protein